MLGLWVAYPHASELAGFGGSLVRIKDHKQAVSVLVFCCSMRPETSKLVDSNVCFGGL